MIGASINPTPKPSNAIPMRIWSRDVEKYSNAHPIKCGILTMIIAFFRPIGSVMIPENTLPRIMRAIAILPANQTMYYALLLQSRAILHLLPSHDASDGVTRTVSLGFVVEPSPVSAGIRMTGKAVTMPKSRSRRFLIATAIACNNNTQSDRQPLARQRRQ